MKKIAFLLVILAGIAMTMSGCAHSPNVTVSISETTHIYGFWGGAWHGIISVFSFIGSLFDDSIKVYAVNNNGHWYDFGFVFGLSPVVYALRFIWAIVKAALS